MSRNKVEQVGRTMSAKTEQINMRISLSLKEDLTEAAREAGISMSDYIRQALQNSIEQANGQDLDSGQLWEKYITRMLYAGATIVNLDTNIPLDQCISTTLRVIEGSGHSISDLLNAPRNKLEEEYLKIQEKIKGQLNISEEAMSYLNLMATMFSSLLYHEHVFEMSPMSVVALERIRKVLEPREAN